MDIPLGVDALNDRRSVQLHRAAVIR